MSNIIGVASHHQPVATPEIPVIDKSGHTPEKAGSFNNTPIVESNSAPFIFDVPGDLSSEDFMVALLSLTQQMKITEINASRADIIHHINLSVSDKHQLEQASEATLEAKNALTNVRAKAKGATQSKKQAAQVQSEASSSLQKVESELSVANEAVNAAKSVLTDKKKQLLETGRIAEQAEQDAIEARKIANDAAKAAKAAEGTDEEEQKKVIAVKSEARAQQAESHFTLKSGEVQRLVDDVDQGKSELYKKTVVVDSLDKMHQDAMTVLANAKESFTVAKEVNKQAIKAVVDAEKHFQTANAAEQSLIDSYQLNSQWYEQQLDSVVSDLAVKDTTGASAMLSELIRSGSAIASALIAAILQNSVANDLESGVDHSTRMQLINQVAEREAISKMAEQSEQTVMKSEVSKDLSQLYIGILSAFSVFGKSRLSEVVAGNLGLLTGLNHSVQPAKGEIRQFPENNPKTTKFTKAMLSNNMQDIKDLMASSAELIQSDELVNNWVNSLKNKRSGVFNKV